MNKNQIIEDVKRKIRDEEFLPGAYLIERDLCEHYGISRTPMREILFSLVNTGLVVQQKGKGFSIRKLDIKQLFEIFEARESVEAMAAKLCCQKATKMDHKKFLEIREQLEALDADAHAEESIRLGRVMHKKIIETAGNSLLSEFHEKLNNMVTLTANMTRKISGIEVDSRMYHIYIINSILEGDEDKSEQYMREHIIMTCQHLLHSLYPNYSGLPVGSGTN
ncbi:GntR family transcriptional regulator [Marispirochaeta sp.]|jgi:DNA-binding GntR family transcriptional regulator|uniref:GntR family transcriptional regulator n=1 Tax=Marispirochaeta sp. TaxID=2038653 RepID=UPI0029C71D15|nr:GntR family transcriptional regulator [Marispirochaeta sp.]